MKFLIPWLSRFSVTCTNPESCCYQLIGVWPIRQGSWRTQNEVSCFTRHDCSTFENATSSKRTISYFFKRFHLSIEIAREGKELQKKRTANFLPRLKLSADRSKSIQTYNTFVNCTKLRKKVSMVKLKEHITWTYKAPWLIKQRKTSTAHNIPVAGTYVQLFFRQGRGGYWPVFAVSRKPRKLFGPVILRCV